MKKLMVTVLLAIMLLASCMPEQKRGEQMAIDFNGTSSYIEYPINGLYANLPAFTVMGWINLDSISAGGDGIVNKMTFPYTGWDFSVQNYPAIGRTNQLQFWYAWSGPVGGLAGWGVNNAVSVGSILHVAVSYDRTSAANDPSIYVNGVSQAVTEMFTPSGSPVTDTDVLEIGASGAFLDGKIYNLLIYNRILSAAEIADAYNSRLAIPTYRGLVFAPNMFGATGLQNFDGVALGSTNYVMDMVAGALGTPVDSPIARAETFLTVR